MDVPRAAENLPACDGQADEDASMPNSKTETPRANERLRKVTGLMEKPNAGMMREGKELIRPYRRISPHELYLKSLLCPQETSPPSLILNKWLQKA